MNRVVLGVTGSVAAVRTAPLFEALKAEGLDVLIVATEPALRFFDPNALNVSEPVSPEHETAASASRSRPAAGPLIRDADEWAFDRWEREDPVLHIELRRWADLLVVAPLDANTLGKFALGLSDNALSCLFRAWDASKPLVLAPAMNTLMWDSPVTLRHLRQLLEDRAERPPSEPWGLEEAAEVWARHAPNLVLVPPVSKRLACGDQGVGGMAEVPAIVEAVLRALRNPSPSATSSSAESVDRTG